MRSIVGCCRLSLPSRLVASVPRLSLLLLLRHGHNGHHRYAWEGDEAFWVDGPGAWHTVRPAPQDLLLASGVPERCTACDGASCCQAVLGKSGCCCMWQHAFQHKVQALKKACAAQGAR